MKFLKPFVIGACALVALAAGVSSATAGQPAKATPLAYDKVTGSCGDTTPGAVSISGGSAHLSVPEQMSWAQIRTSPGALQLKDITRLTFGSQASDPGVVYMSIKTDHGSVVYSPNTQLGGEQGVGSWATHNVLTGTVRLNDDRGDHPDSHWNEVLAVAGNDQVTGVNFTAGCANPVGNDGAQVQYDDLTINNKIANFQPKK